MLERFRKFIARLAETNKKEIGESKLICCHMNREQSATGAAKEYQVKEDKDN